MKPAAVHQLVPSLQPGDAVSGHSLQVQALLRREGLVSEIFVEGAHPDYRRRVHHFDRLPRRLRRAGDETMVMYQMAIGSAAGDTFAELPSRKLLNYHNITPARFFRVWDPHEAIITQVGRRQLERFAGDVELAVAVSRFNETELEAAGFGRTTVAPVLVDLEAFEREVDERALAALAQRRAGPQLLFVGRAVPHKAQHDLIRAFAAYRHVYEPGAHLHLVGGSGPERYWDALHQLVQRLDLGQAVTLTGRVGHGELAAHYRHADLFVCLSDHEGFGIPFLEAMHHGTPVVAFAAAAVPETLADAGLVLHRKDPLFVAAAINRVLSDDALRRRLRQAAQARLDHFSLERTRARFLAALRPVLEGATSGARP